MSDETLRSVGEHLAGQLQIVDDGLTAAQVEAYHRVCGERETARDWAARLESETETLRRVLADVRRAVDNPAAVTPQRRDPRNRYVEPDHAHLRRAVLTVLEPVSRSPWDPPEDVVATWTDGGDDAPPF